MEDFGDSPIPNEEVDALLEATNEPVFLPPLDFSDILEGDLLEAPPSPAAPLVPLPEVSQPAAAALVAAPAAAAQFWAESARNRAGEVDPLVPGAKKTASRFPARMQRLGDLPNFDDSPRLFILTPEDAAFRAEKEISVRLVMKNLPVGRDKMRLPRHTLLLPKNREKADDEDKTVDAETLALSAQVVCATPVWSSARGRSSTDNTTTTTTAADDYGNDDDNNNNNNAEFTVDVDAVARIVHQAQAIGHLPADLKTPEPATHGSRAVSPGSTSSSQSRPSNDPKVWSGIDSYDPIRGDPVRPCRMCIDRETKRVSRSGSDKKKDDSKLLALEGWKADSKRRIVGFSSDQNLTWKRSDDGQVHYIDLKMRILCYCRHVTEKRGFHVILTLKDESGNCISGMSSLIKIDDKDAANKTTRPAEAAAQDGAAGAQRQPSRPPSQQQQQTLEQPSLLGELPFHEWLLEPAPLYGMAANNDFALNNEAPALPPPRRGSNASAQSAHSAHSAASNKRSWDQSGASNGLVRNNSTGSNKSRRTRRRQSAGSNHGSTSPPLPVAQSQAFDVQPLSMPDNPAAGAGLFGGLDQNAGGLGYMQYPPNVPDVAAQGGDAQPGFDWPAGLDGALDNADWGFYEDTHFSQMLQDNTQMPPHNWGGGANNTGWVSGPTQAVGAFGTPVQYQQQPLDQYQGHFVSAYVNPAATILEPAATTLVQPATPTQLLNPFLLAQQLNMASAPTATATTMQAALPQQQQQQQYHHQQLQQPRVSASPQGRVPPSNLRMTPLSRHQQ